MKRNSVEAADFSCELQPNFPLENLTLSEHHSQGNGVPELYVAGTTDLIFVQQCKHVDLVLSGLVERVTPEACTKLSHEPRFCREVPQRPFCDQLVVLRHCFDGTMLSTLHSMHGSQRSSCNPLSPGTNWYSCH